MSNLIDRFEKRSKEQVAESTAKKYTRAVRQFSDWLDKPLTEATEYDVEDFLLEMSENDYAGSTIRGAYAGINKFYTKSRRIEENPVEDLSIGGWDAVKGGSKKAEKLGSDVHYLKTDEIQTLVDNVPSPKLRNELIIKLLYQTGLRGGELVKIKLRDIDTEQRAINIHANKSHRNRTVYYQPSLSTQLEIWTEVERQSTIHAAESDYLFPTNYGERLKRCGLDTVVRKAVKSAEMDDTLYTDAGGDSVPRVTAHSLRHSFAVHSLRRGMDVRTLQELLGHADIETTQVYLDLAKEDVKQKARQFGPSLES